jgi:hypothetical protein
MSMRSAGAQAREAKRATRPLVERLARLGYASKGTVYIIMGILAFQAAQGAGNPRVDQQAAFAKLITQPFGKVLLAVLIVGMVSYALWRLLQATTDPEHEGSRGKALLNRAGYAASGLSYLALSVAAWGLLNGRAGGGQSSNTRDLTARLMQQPFGRYLVGAIGLVILAAGLVQFYQALTGKFERRFKANELKPEERRWIMRAGRLGYGAKGVIYVLVGSFLVQAAYRYDPSKAGGLSDALVALARQPYGAYLLAAVAIGLIAYGVYSFMLALHRRIYVW